MADLELLLMHNRVFCAEVGVCWTLPFCCFKSEQGGGRERGDACDCGAHKQSVTQAGVQAGKGRG